MESNRTITISAERKAIITNMLIPLWRQKVKTLKETDIAPSVIYGREIGLKHSSPYCMMFGGFCWGFEAGVQAVIELLPMEELKRFEAFLQRQQARTK